MSRPVASVLVRRGISNPASAEEFFAAAESHDPFEFEGMSDAVEAVRATVEAGRKVTIYGDFDCDGVCATSILVAAIRDLGGDCDWFIPDRISDGYGLNADAIRQIAERGTSLVITVDCGVTAVEEVALARELGMEIVVTDHHQAGPELPDCTILHPLVSGYPFASLCGAAVAAKLASALRRDTPQAAERDEADLDLVALATVADVMPLTGENRHLVREGVKVARRARRVGLAALMEGARVEPSRLTSEDFGFRLGPRINAAGRLYRADAGVELFLADSRERAGEIATELGGVNAERRRVGQAVETEAKAELKRLGEPGPAVVVAGEGWHPGVVGIVASTLVKATGRPSVVISIEGETGRGSARSVPGLDLHAALGETAELLETFGGHAAAAGLSIRVEKIDEFREALGRAVADRIGTEPVEPTVEFDAVAGGADLGLDLAEELEQLQPFGNANPAVKLLVPAARIENLREMGEGKHCRFSICSGSHRANGVCFGRSSLGLAEGERGDLVAELAVNHWNGSIEPQLRVVHVQPVVDAGPLEECGPGEWWDRFEIAMARGLDASAGGEAAELELAAGPDGLPGVAVAELISSGERLVILGADARQRWKGLGGAALARFIPDSESGPAAESAVAGVWAGSPRSVFEAVVDVQVLLTDYATLAGPQPPAIGDFDRVALLDPPFMASALSGLRAAGLPAHLLAGPDEFEFAARVAGHRLDLTAQLRDLFRALKEVGAGDGGELSGEPLRDALGADGKTTRSPEEAAVLLRVLVETGLARSEGAGSARWARVVSSKKTDLADSVVFAHHFELHQEHQRFLSHFDKQTQKP
ncbi:MAG: single-stranded-DNA-specific exonuclease RecJ [Solirubrobacterales bacterium]|nr:single-stranded-DNA-specific exonuclease RecJ [Solirubrobacterales bacterium]OJU94861.1 MAG: single-stranded-DNA-specific exonuclease RecJ [Solirubrobacterales bacterium 67-14]